MTRIGTSHFLSFAAAVRYYRAYDGNNAASGVLRRLKLGEIHIGRPAEKPGQRTVLIDDGTRWAIEEGNLPGQFEAGAMLRDKREGRS